ncbi:MAG: response regulator [Bacteriovoracaceae bacterium]
MSNEFSKILVADDSLTIQKVIKITLSDQDYEVLESLTEKQLMETLKSQSIDIVLLDFALSEVISGYDLARNIKKASPDCDILMMYGAFDNIDDKQLKEIGVEKKIVKPFESGKFTKLINEILEAKKSKVTKSVNDKKMHKLEPVYESDDESELWVVDNKSRISTPKPKVPNLDVDNKSAFTNELKDWEIELPPKILATENESDDIFELPPVIDFPNVESVEISVPKQNKKPSFVSLDALNLDIEEEDDVKWDEKIAPKIVKEEDSKRVKKIEKVIEEDVSVNDFWSVDSDENAYAKIESAVGDALKNKKIIVEEPTLEKHVKQEVINEFKIDENFEKELQRKIEPILEKLIKEYFEKRIDKVAWEIIPDLAENLIKVELEKIASSVLNQK